MRRKTIALFAAAGAFALGSPQANAISVGFQAIIGNQIQFDPASDTFRFVNGAGNDTGLDFTLALVDGAFKPGTSLLTGEINGTFSISGITSVDATTEKATVTSSFGANLKIHAADGLFEGKINWIELRTEGTGGDLNLFGQVNLTDIDYSGFNPDLLALMGADDEASAAVSFTFNPAKSISQLTQPPTSGTSSTHQTGYTGALTSVPDGGTSAILLGLSLIGLGAVRRKS